MLLFARSHSDTQNREKVVRCSLRDVDLVAHNAVINASVALQLSLPSEAQAGVQARAGDLVRARPDFEGV